MEEEVIVAINLGKIKGEIIGVQPIYTERGDGTRIILRTGEMVFNRGIRSVMSVLFHSYAIEIPDQRKQVEIRLHRQGVMPFHLSPDRVFVPVKMRKAVAPKDMVYGFLDIRYIRGMEIYEGRGCIVTLIDGRQFEIMSKPGTASRAYYLAKDLLEQLQREKGGDAAEKLAMDSAICKFKALKRIERKLDELKELLKKRRELLEDEDEDDES